MTTNDWCRTLGIETPRLEAVADHADANTYALLIVALLERGEPLTLPAVAARFAQARIFDERRALLSLSRCRPARAPVYRDGDRYALDPHDSELDLWVFRLGLRPPKVARPAPPPADVRPLPGADVPLSSSELDEAWKNASLQSNWSAQRLALAVLDANGGGAAPPSDIVDAVAKRTKWHGLNATSAKFKNGASAITVLEDGRWSIAKGAADALRATRIAVRAKVEQQRRNASMRTDPAEFEANRQAYERQRAAHATELAALTRCLIVGFPPGRPRAVALLDVSAREVTTYVDDELAAVSNRIGAFDVIGGVDIRALLRALRFDPREQRLAELGPPQKTKQLNRQGRTLEITTTMLVQGSCGISKPFGEEGKLSAYAATNDVAKLRRRLEADVKSLCALYEYGRLHGYVRLRWGFIDERLPAPWVHRDETTLHHLKQRALAMNVPLEVVVGSTPGWAEPWSRVQRAAVVRDASGYRATIFGHDGYAIDDDDVQLARLSVGVH